MGTEILFVGESESNFVDRRRKVWLECDSQPHDFRSVLVLGTRLVIQDVEVVAFLCPRCGGKHESLLFA